MASPPKRTSSRAPAKVSAASTSSPPARPARPAPGVSSPAVAPSEAIVSSPAVVVVGRAAPVQRPAARAARPVIKKIVVVDSRGETQGNGDDRDDAGGDDAELVEPDAAVTDAADEDDEDVGKVDWDDDDDDDSPKPAKTRRPRSSTVPPASRALAPTSSAGLERLDPLAIYMREVQRHPVLSPDEQHALARTFLDTQDPALAAKLVTTNLRLVVKIAYEYRRACKNIMDLVQEGNIGLLQAVKRYDPYRGVRVSSYAAWWIRAYMLRYILNDFRLVKIGTTQNQRRLFFNLSKARAKLTGMGIDPTDDAIAKQLDVTASDVREMSVRLGSSEASLDAPVGNGDGEGNSLARVNTMPSTDEPADETLAHQQMVFLLREHLVDFRRTLPTTGKDIVIFDRRIVAEEPLTLQEIGESYGISRERVRQIEQRITTNLRAFLLERVGDTRDL